MIYTITFSECSYNVNGMSFCKAEDLNDTLGRIKRVRGLKGGYLKTYITITEAGTDFQYDARIDVDHNTTTIQDHILKQLRHIYKNRHTMPLASTYKKLAIGQCQLLKKIRAES